MVRAVAAALLVVTCVGVAEAGSNRKIAVESDPPGASVYINEKEAGPACAGTPCTISAPPGEVIIIVELDGHTAAFQTLDVPRRGRVPKVTVKLVPAIGTIVIDGPAGALVQVDDVDQGKAPTRVDVPEDAHHVVVTMDGKPIYDQFVDVTTGGETTVTPKQVALAASVEGAAGGGDGEAKVVKIAVPKTKRDRFITASAAVDIAFRNFSYSGVATPLTLRDWSEGGQVLAGPLIELWPGELIGVDPLRGLSLLARMQFGVHPQSVTGNGVMDDTNTFWQSVELSLRYRRTIAQKFTAEAGIGYVRDQFQFNGKPQDINLVPDVDYRCVRLGLRVSMLLGRLEPYLSAENRVVISAGKVQARFANGTDASGYRAAVGLNARMGSFVGRVEGSLLNYTWDMKFDPTAMYRATGATDSIKQIQLAVGYQY